MRFLLDPEKRLSAAKLIFTALVFASFLIVTSENRDPDLGWHLKAGEWIFEHRSIQRFDEWSHTMPGYEWTDHEWFVNAWIYRMKSLDLWPVVIAVFALLIFLPFAFWIKRAASLPELLFLGALAVELFRSAGVRPQLISFALFFILFEFLRKFFAEPKLSYSYIFGIPIFFFFWANLHGGFPAGLLLLFLFALGDTISITRAGKLTPNRIASHVFVLGTGLTLTLMNPHGFDLYREAWSVTTSTLSTKYIIEWLPAFALPSLAMPVIIALPFLLFLKYLRRYEIRSTLSFFIFFIAYLKSARNILFYAVAAMPIISEGFTRLKEEISRAEGRLPTPPKIKRAISALKALIAGALIVYWAYALYNYSEAQGKYPEAATAFLREEADRGAPVTLLNTYGWGGYIIENAPEIKVFIDGRMPHWKDARGNSAMEEYVRIFYSADDRAKREILARRKINVVLVDAEQDLPEDGWIKKLAERVPETLRKRIGQSRSIKTLNKILTFPSSLIYGETTDFKELLLGDGWEAAYEDDVAIMFRCPEYDCSRLPTISKP